MVERPARRETGANPEPIIGDADRLWLGGVFSIKGAVQLKTTIAHDRVYSTPYLAVTHAHEDLVRHIANLIGANVVVSKGRNPTAVVRGKSVVYRLLELYQYIPNRWGDITAIFTAMEDLLPQDKRDQIFAYLAQTPDVSVYSRLLEKPDYVSGILDSGGTWTRTKDPNYDVYYLAYAVKTTNIPLKEALINDFEGNLHQGSWRVTSRDELQRLVGFTSGYMRFPQTIPIQ